MRARDLPQSSARSELAFVTVIKTRSTEKCLKTTFTALPFITGEKKDKINIVCCVFCKNVLQKALLSAIIDGIFPRNREAAPGGDADNSFLEVSHSLLPS